MGGYRVRSGQSLPNLNSTNLPNLPELNSLNRKQNDHKADASHLSFDDLALSDEEPTDVGSPDDILAAVGGIDGWDNVPNAAAKPGASGAKTDEPNYELSILNGTFLGEEEEDTTTVTESPFNKLTPSSQGLSAPKHLLPGLPGLKPSANGLPSLKSSEGIPSLKSSEGIPSLKSSEGIPSLKSSEGLPSPKSSEGLPSPKSNEGLPSPKASEGLPSPKASEGLPSPKSSEDLPSPKASEDLPSPKASEDLPSLKSDDIPDDHRSIDSMDDPLPNLKPSSINNQSTSGVVSNAAAAVSTVAVSPQPVESVQQINTSPVVTNSQQATAQTAQTAPQQASAPTSREEKMTDEEQLAEILNSMTPEERAEYEAHCREQERQEAEARRAKQRELQEMYGNPNLNQPKSSPVGLIIGIIIVLLIFGGLIFWLLTTDHAPENAVQEQQTQQEAVEAAPVVVRADPLNTYPVNISLNGATLLYINGVETPIGGPYQFVADHRNTVMAFADGMVPFIQTFDNKSRVSNVSVELAPATHYLKGSLKFRVADQSLVGTGLVVTLDGRSLSNFPSSDATDVVLGFPHILIIEKPGFAKHMHIIWPENPTTTIDIPSLEPENNALSGTRCSVEKFPPSAKPYGIRITYGEQVFDKPIVAHVTPGAIIEYYITREQRFPLQLALIPDGFGSVTLDTALLRDSIGKSIVSFTRPADSNMRVCMRRIGELICPDMAGETTVPSGPDWEFIGLENEDLSSRQIRGGQKQELQKDRKYVFEVGLSSSNSFAMRQTGYDRVKDGIK